MSQSTGVHVLWYLQLQSDSRRLAPAVPSRQSPQAGGKPSAVVLQHRRLGASVGLKN